MIKTYVLYFDHFAEFEIIIAVGNLAARSEITAVAIENRPYVSEEKQFFLPQKTISEVSADEVDLFLIPGGDTASIIDNLTLKKLIAGLNEKGKIIGAICGGVLLLGNSGVLEGRNYTGFVKGYEIDRQTKEKCLKNANFLDQDVVVDGNIVTARGQAFIEFGVEIADRMGIYEIPEDREKDYRWIKNR